jgi:hypothetical protein
MRPLDEIAATIESMPEVLRALLAPLDDAALRVRPAPGEWCVLEVIGHLLATEGPAFRERVRAIVGGAPQVPAIDVSLDGTGRDFVNEDLGDLLDELAAERAVSAAFLRSLDPSDLERESDLPPHGAFAAGDFVHEWPFHDQDHLQQMLSAIKPQYLPHMTDAMRSALAPDPDGS